MSRIAPLVALALVACTTSFAPTYAVRALIAEETHLSSAPPGHARAGDAVVRVIAHHGLCSGSLVDARVVVTAQHCVTAREAGERVAIAPGDVRIELGGGYLPWGRLGVTAIEVCPHYDEASDGDVAALILDLPVPIDVPQLTPRLAAEPPELGTLRVVGYGSPGAMWEMPEAPGFVVIRSVRSYQRGDVLWRGEGALALAMKSDRGDSGGPAIDEATGDLVGVVSRGSEATDADVQHHVTVISRVDRCRETIERARERARPYGGGTK